MKITRDLITQNEIENDGKTIHLYFDTAIGLYVAYGFSAFFASHIVSIITAFSEDLHMPVALMKKPDVTELTICIMIHNLKHHINKGVVTRLHLADLFSKLRYTEYDEDKLQRMLHALKLEKFTARILTILGDSFHLEEGYMPIEPVDDKLTNRIRQQLIKANVQ